MKKAIFIYKYNDISCTHARGHGPEQENLEKMCDMGGYWCIF